MTDDTEEWGPWIEHDGTRCPLPVGTVFQAQAKCKCADSMGIAVISEGCRHPLCVDWVDLAAFGRAFMCNHCGQKICGECIIRRYRIWRPRGVQMLIEIAENPRKKADHHAG